MGFRRKVNYSEDADLVSKGVHVARCVEADLKPIRNNPEDDNLVLTFEILTPGHKGRKLMNWTPLSEAAEGIASRVFKAFEVPLPKKGKQVEISDDMFIGKKVKLKVDHEVYEGELRANIKRIMPLGDGKSELVKDADGEEVSSLSVPVGDDDDEDLAEDSLPF